MKRLTVYLACMWCVIQFVFSQNRNNHYENYIEMYKDLAITEMEKHHIPASITLAQGLLESSAGRSKLSRYFNNHFGIKCGRTWRGRKPIIMMTVRMNVSENMTIPGNHLKTILFS